MKLFVCWGTFPTVRPGGHPCANAHNTDGRREIEELSGQKVVPVLVTDSGEVINESKRIVAWAEANPAP